LLPAPEAAAPGKSLEPPKTVKINDLLPLPEKADFY